jgi:mono/diheme cytochrome c family protein
MTDVPNQYRTHPGAYLQWHEDARFGCTICHRGQGAATNFADAKAEDRHWDYPLLPLDLTQSSCGICHTPAEVAQRGGEVYARGAALFVSKGCRSCHKLDGLGGSLGPALDNEGLKVRGQLPFGHVQGPHTLAQWLIEHFDDPRQVVAGSQMPTPGLSRDERTALTAFLLSLQQRDLPKSYLSPLKHLALYRVQHPEPRSGDQLYADLCQSCHDTGIYGRYDKFFARFIPAIRGETYQRIAEPAYVAANIREGRAGTIMPAWGAAAGGLSEEEILRLASTLLGRELDATQTAATAPIRSHPRAARGDARRGTSLFAKQCSGCHGLSAEGRLGPSLVAPALQRYASDDFLYATIAFGRRNTAMPAFLAVAPAEGGFQEPQLDDLIAFLRRIGAPAGQDMTALSTTPSVAPRAPAAAPSAPDITAAAPAGAQTR